MADFHEVVPAARLGDQQSLTIPMRERACAVLIMMTMALSACGVRSPTMPPPPAASPPTGESYVEVGTASWYGPWHDGRRTASGERYNMNAMTAAHRTLPFGTIVRVTNLENHRSVRVRINDRGPYVGDRILDLSAAAARSLGLKARGIAEVRIEIVTEHARSLTSDAQNDSGR